MSQLWLSPNAFDATRIRSLSLCRRRFKWEQVDQLRRRGGDFNAHIEFGQAWHEATRAYDQARLVGENPLPVALRRALDLSKSWPVDTGVSSKTRASLARALVWYDDKFGSESGALRILTADSKPAMEVAFQFPLFGDGNPAVLCGNMDGIVEFGGEIWVLERKTTGSALSGFYWAQYDPNFQIDIYCLAAHLMWPEWKIKGVLVEAMQTGVGFSRFERKMFRRSGARLAETLAAVQHEVSALQQDMITFECADTRESQEAADKKLWRPNFASCMSNGGCPYRVLCATDPSLRQWEISNGFTARSDPWDPLNKGGDE